MKPLRTKKINKRLGELDTFRSIAVLAVLFFHCTMFRPESKLGFFLGITGVDLFFMISGFVIFMSIDNRRKGREFVLARIIRLYPTYWLLATFTFTTYFILNYLNYVVPYIEISGNQFLANLTMFQYYLNVPNMDGSYWTLIIELLFYIFIYCLHALKLLDKIVVIGGTFCALIFLLFIGIHMKWIPDYTTVLPLLYHFPLFYMGILFYKIYNEQQLLWSYSPLLIISIALQLFLHEYGRATQFMSVWWYANMLVINGGLFILFIKGKLKFTINPISQFFGEISYPLYLIHQPLVYGVIIPFMVDEKGINFWFSTLVVAVPLALLLATLFTYFIEKPLIKWLKRKLLNC